MPLSGASVSILPTKTYPFEPTINPALFPLLWVVLCTAGLIAMAMFFVYELSTSKSKRDLKKELTLAAISSLLLGFGVLFLVLWAGVWV